MNAASDRVCYLNGDWVALGEARVSVLDRGFIFGDAIYEVIPALSGRLFLLPEHLARLARNLAEVGIRNPHDDTQWRGILEDLVARNGAGDLVVYLQVTRGVAERDHAIPAGITPTVFAMCKPLTVNDGLAQVAAITLPDNRWGRCDIKSTSLLANVLLRNQAIAAGAYEAILFRNGEVTEGAASNVFVVVDNVVTTPELSRALLPGVTRNMLVETLNKVGVDIQEGVIPIEELTQAEEIWLTSSTRDLVCVNRLDGVPVGDGANYPCAQRAHVAFSELRQALSD